jgi:hypothetical protein
LRKFAVDLTQNAPNPFGPGIGFSKGDSLITVAVAHGERLIQGGNKSRFCVGDKD